MIITPLKEVVLTFRIAANHYRLTIPLIATVSEKLTMTAVYVLRIIFIDRSFLHRASPLHMDKKYSALN
jgi:hypothetical protein